MIISANSLSNNLELLLIVTVLVLFECLFKWELKEFQIFNKRTHKNCKCKYVLDYVIRPAAMSYFNVYKIKKSVKNTIDINK